MTNAYLKDLGQRVARVRYQQQLKQSQLAREASVSLRTLQRLEAGQAVKTDVLLKLLNRLERLDPVLDAVMPAALSPYEILAQAGLSSSDLGTPQADDALRHVMSQPPGKQPLPGRRVRRTRRMSKKAPIVSWPEDQTP